MTRGVCWASGFFCPDRRGGLIPLELHGLAPSWGSGSWSELARAGKVRDRAGADDFPKCIEEMGREG